MPTIKPSPEQVHAYLPQRPTFTQTSRPSIEEVQDIVDVVADAVTAESITGEFPTYLAGKVRQVVALNVAAQIENSYFPEQGIGTDSAADYLYRQYQAELLGLRTIIGRPGGTGVSSVGNAFAIDMTPPRTRALDAEAWYPDAL